MISKLFTRRAILVPSKPPVVAGPYLGHAPRFTVRPLDAIWTDPRFNIEAGRAAR